MSSAELLLLPAHEQAHQIAAKELSAVELLTATVERYERVDPVVNAVVVERIDEAMEQAQIADQAVVDGDALGPLHGVLMTVKEVIDWVGTPSTWGDPRFGDYFPERNAVVFDRLIEAGAIVWAKTNVPLNLGEWQTFNDIYGRTLNPFDLDRTPGGSSGGSAVALATGMAALEVGSDIGGSIRFPAHYCGVFGHKPTFGAINPDGHTYPGQAADVDLNVVGPMARTARDLTVAFDVMADRASPREARESLGGFTVGVMLDNPLGGAQDDEMTAVLRRAVEELVNAGMKVLDVVPPVDFERAHHNYLMLNYAATSLAYASVTGEPTLEISHLQWLELSNERHEIRRRWAEYFTHVDLLICPVAASAAPPHQIDIAFSDQQIPVNGRLEPIFDQWVWAGIANGTYLPSTAIPAGHTSAGLPVGFQALGPFGQDQRCLAFAELAERCLGGFVAPPMAL